MKLPGTGLVRGVPRLAIIAGVPFAAFIVMISFSLAMGNGEKPAPPPTLDVAVQRTGPAPQAAPAATPTPTFRTNCNDIRGTPYKNDDERTWFLANCSGATQAAGGGTTASGAGASVTAFEVGSGDRLVISKIGVDAPIRFATVSADGVMPNPNGYFHADLYRFPNQPGLGGEPGKGNSVLAGHVDCAACGPGGTPGLAIFYYVRNLVPNDVIEYYSAGGGYFKFVVTAVADYLPDADWANLVSAGAADLTLITCIGTFQSAIHEYTHRRVVQARRV